MRRRGGDSDERRRWYAGHTRPRSPLAIARSVFVTTLLFGAFAMVLLDPPRSPGAQPPAFQLTSGSGTFTLTGTVEAAPTGSFPTTGCQGHSAVLAPGQVHCMLYTITNPLDIPISITAITGSAGAFRPARKTPRLPECKYTDVAVSTFSGSLPVPSRSVRTVGVPIELQTDGNQNNCEGGTFTLDFAATAQFTDNTTTALVVPSSGQVGSPVTLVATVTGTNPSLDGHPPAGTVTFYRCVSLSACASPTKLGTGVVDAATGVATFKTASLPAGTTYVEATYAGTGTSFNPSSSSVVPVVIRGFATCVHAPRTGADIVLKGTIHGNYVVPPFESVWLDGGTITGNVVVPVFSSFASSAGTIGENLTSLGTVSLQGTTVGGRVSAGGGLGIGPSTSIGGNLTAATSLPLCVVGTTLNPVVVGGNISVHGLPAFGPSAQLCGITAKGSLTYSFNAAPVIIGAASDCAGSDIGGALSVQHNAAAVAIDSNDVHGNISISFDAGGILESNTTRGGCWLGPDSPPVSGSGNHASKTSTCNRTA